MTLQCAKVDLYSCWEPGQAYSAASRVRTLASLYLLSMPDWPKLERKRVDPVVHQYDRAMRQNCTVV